MLNLVQKAKALLPLLLFGGAGQVCWAIKSILVGYLEQNSSPWGNKRGCVALPFTFFKN
jgi:hypothetical protein